MKSLNTLHLINKVFANSTITFTQPRLLIGYSSFWALLFAANLNAQAPTCGTGTNLAAVFTGAAAVNATTGTVSTSANALGVLDGAVASIAANSSLTLDMGSTLLPGDNVFFRYNSGGLTAPMQVLVATAAGGPFTNILQLMSTATMTTEQLVLPLSARYFQFVTNAQAFTLDAVYKTVYSCQPDNIPTCTGTQFLTNYNAGVVSIGATTGTITTSANMIGVYDGLLTTIAANSSMIADYGSSLPTGTVLTVYYTGAVANPLSVQASNSAGGPFIDIAQLPGTAAATSANVTLPITARYIKFVTTASSYTVDAAPYKKYVCVANPVPTCGVGQTLLNYALGAQSVSGQTGTPTNPLNVVGTIDGDYVNLAASQSVTLDFGAAIAAGNTLSLRYNSNANITPLQVLVATAAGGPYTNIKQVPANATVNTYSIVLPLAARYVQLVTNAGGGNYNVDALISPQYVCVTPAAAVCSDPAVAAQTETGATAVTATTGTVTTSANALGVYNGTDAVMAANSTLTLDMGSTFTAGNSLKVYYNSTSLTSPVQVLVATAPGGPYTNIAQLPASTTETTATILLPLSARYIQFETTLSAYNIDAVTKITEMCVTEPNPSCTASQVLSSYKQGAQSLSGVTVGTVGTPSNALQPINGATANMSANSEFTVDMGSAMVTGTRLSVTYIAGATTAPLQISVATASGGPYTVVKQLPGVTTSTTTSFLLPVAGQFVRFNTTTVNFNIDAVTFPVSACVTNQAPTCSSGQLLLQYASGLSGAGVTTGTITTPTNLLDNVNGTETTFNPSASLVVNYTAVVPAGTVLTFTYRTNTTGLSPMFVWASTAAGGPFTNIAQLDPSTTTTTATVTLPAAAQYFKLETNASIYYYIDAVTFPIYACVTPPVSTCSSGQVSASYPVGLSAATQTVATVSTPANAIGTLDAATANMSANAEMSANFAAALPAGTVLSFTYISGSVTAPLQVLVSSAAGGPFTNIAQLPGSTSTVTNTVTLPIGAQYLKLQTNATNYNIDAVTYMTNVCVASTVPTCMGTQVLTDYPTGVASVFTTTGTVTTGANIVGTLNGLNAVVSVNSSLTADMGSLLAAGTVVTLNYVANTSAGYLQVAVSATSGGIYTNIDQIIGSTTATTGSFVLPFAAQFIRLTTGASATFTLDAMTYLNYNCVANPVSACAVNELPVSYPAGLTAVSATTGTVTTSANITGTLDGNTAALAANATLTADFGSVVPAGTVLTFRYSSGGGTAPLHVSTSSVAAVGPFTEVDQIPVSGATVNYTLTLPFATQYIKLAADAVAFTLDAITRPVNTCVTNPAAACPSGEMQASYPVGIGSVVGAPVGATNPLNLLGTMDGANVNLAANGQITGDLGMNYPAGSVLTFNYNSNALTAPLQVSVATAAGGPYTNIAQVPASTTVSTAMVTIPFTTRYVRMNTTSVVFNIDAVTRLEYVCIPAPGPTCTAAQTLVSGLNGISAISATTGSIGTSTNLVGIKDGLTTSIAANSTVTGNLGQLLSAGTQVTIYYTSSGTAAPLKFYIAPAFAGPYTDIAQLTPSTTATSATITLTTAAQYIKLESAATSFTVDAITYTDKICVTPTAHTCPGGFRLSIFQAGASAVVTSTGTVTTPANAIGTWNGTTAILDATESLTLDMGMTANAGDPLTVYYSTNTANGQFEVLGATASGGPYTHLGYALGSTTATSVQFTLNANVQYVQLVAMGLTLSLDAVTYNQYQCVAYNGIAGCVFYDTNNNGANDAELGVGGITVRAYDASNTLVATVVTSYGVPTFLIPAGYYEFANLTPGAWYRIEYELSPNSGLFPSTEGTDNNTSVEFIQGGSADHCFGVYQPSLYCSVLSNPRVTGATGSIGGTNAVFSWQYYDHSTTGTSTLAPTSLTKDVKFAQTGALWGLASQRGTNLIYAGALTSDHTAAFPNSPHSTSAIYLLDYNSANGLQDYVGYKHLVNLSALGIDVSTKNPTRSGSAYTFGEIGLGGLDITEDGKYMYVVNMGNGKLIKVDISGVDYNNLPATAPTSAVEISIPAAYAQCGTDVFRPTLLKNYNNKIYVGGVCDGENSGTANLNAKLLSYDPATGTWAQVLSFPLDFTAGGLNSYIFPQLKWNDFTTNINYIQPVFADLAFDIDGSMSLGFVNRYVLISATSSQQTGYMLRTSVDANGNQQLENGGIVGPHTTLYTGGGQSVNDGPGGDWFYQQSSLNPTHIYTYNGGLFQKTGEQQIIAGVVDPYCIFCNGAAYFNVNTGIQDYNIVNEGGISKVARITGGEQVCEAIPEMEIGNRVWSDLNGNGIQDANDPGIGNVTIELYADIDQNGVPDGAALATTTTAADGTWYFNESNVPDGDPSTPGSQRGLRAYTGYVVRVGSSDWAAGIGAGDLLGFTMTLSNVGGAGQPDVRDNDATLPMSNLPTIALKTGAPGDNNHSYDIGFLQSCSMVVTSATPTACANNLYNLAVVVTYINPPSGNITVNTNNGGTITVAATTSPQTITLTGLTADGVQDIDVTAFFVATPTCTNTAMDIYDAPAACPCTMTVTSATPSACVSATNNYSLSVVVTYVNQPSGNITVNTSNGGTITVAQTNSPQTITLTGLTSDGVQDIDVTAFFVATPACTNTAMDIYDAPPACPCTMTVTYATPTVCASNLYNVAVVVTYTNQPSGNITVNTTNGGTITVAQTSSPQTITLTGLTADGVQDIDVTAFFVATPNCTNTAMDIYDAPASCLPCQMTVTSATPSACVPATNTYSLSVVVTYANQPSGNITVSTSNGGTVTVAQTSSPQTITLNGLISNGMANIGVTAFFVATPTCTNTLASAYNAPAACDCVQPAANFVPIPAKCLNLVPQDDGRIVLTAFTNADRFGVNAGITYSGPAYAAATTITGINQDLQTGIPNVGGGTYTVRIFNGSNTCFKDYVITVPPGFPCKVDPMGFIYCEESGKIIAGGTITVTPPAGATYVITQNGSTGVYQFFTDAFVPGIYTMTYTPPAGYMASTNRFPGPTLDPTGQPNPYILGSGSASGTVLDNFTTAANPFYMVFNFASGDPEVLNNNIPLKGCCVAPVLTVQNGAVCAGDVINLTTRVTGNTPTGVLTFHLTQADALAGTNTLVNTVVAPAVTTTYYVRSTATGPDGTCSDVESVQVTVVNPPAALATTNGVVCAGGSIDLSTSVANNGGGSLSFYTTQANAQAGTSPLGSSTVSPASATNYYVRSTNGNGCYGIKEITVTIKPLECGVITTTGPN
jgi:hypothetical protein